MVYSNCIHSSVNDDVGTALDKKVLPVIWRNYIGIIISDIYCLYCDFIMGTFLKI